MNLSGQTLGQYHLVHKLGQGAMGTVYAAENAQHHAVAVKVLNPDYVLDVDLRARFEREISVQSTLNHPNIVRIFDYSTHDDKVYFVMQLIKGQTLAYILQRRSYTPLEVWEILNPLAQALQYAHDLGVLHRDVKPSNVLLEREGERMQVFLMDFGLAKRPGTDGTLTDTGISIGTPEYISPEAAAGHLIDQRTDIYSLAVLTYEMLIGILPFDRGSPYLNAIAHVSEPPPPLSKRNPRFPFLLEQIIMRSLAKSPSQRHQSVKEFAEQFNRALMQLPPQEAQTDYWVV